MFCNLFNLSYERNLEEAFAFYFSYVIFAFFISGVFYSLANFFYFLSSYFSGTISVILTYGLPFLTFFIPFLFYTCLSIVIFLKKRLQDRSSVYLVIYTILITFLIPFVLGLCFGFGFLGYDKGFKYGIAGMFIDFFFPNLLFGCIPITILSTKEDRSLTKEIQKMEQEKLEHERKIERQLLTERAIASKIEEIEKYTNNAKEELNEGE